MPLTRDQIRAFAADCGFELAGIAAAAPHTDFRRFEAWRAEDFAGEMTYMTDRRGDLRADPRHLLPSARAILCVGKLYNTPGPAAGAISRYAWGVDYHDVMREGLERLVLRLHEAADEPFEHRICVDTAPLLERSYARAAGLGWIGKNTCLINQARGSWFFLGEILLSLDLQPGAPPPDRCGVCTRCIDACPTAAIVPADGTGEWTVDSRRCISYLTIEKRGLLSSEESSLTGTHVFGCDICQDVCPWNSRAPVTADARFLPLQDPDASEQWAHWTESEFRARFRRSPVWRAKYRGFLRNVALALAHRARQPGDDGSEETLHSLARHPDPVVASTAAGALHSLSQRVDSPGPYLTGRREIYFLETMHTVTPAPLGVSKREFYEHLCQQVSALLGEESDPIANAANTAALLYHSLPDVNWVGFYFTHGQELVLGPFQGKPACVRIPFGKGVCGAAAATAEPVIVPDVNKFPGHIVCDSASQSEIALPLVSWSRILGVLDVDSATLNRFDEDDAEGLEAVVSILIAQAHGNHFPDLAAEAGRAEADQNLD